MKYIKTNTVIRKTVKIIASFLMVVVCVLHVVLNEAMAVSIAFSDHPIDDSINYSIQDVLSGNIPLASFDIHNYINIRSQLFDDGTYYINGEYSGDYLKYGSDSVSALSGLLANLGNSSKWNIHCIDSQNNIYTISSYSNSTKYLAVPSSTTSSSVEIVTVSSGSTIPDRCKWNLSISAHGGCLVKSTYNSRYLYSYGTTLSTSLTTGTNGTIEYNTRVWRIPEVSYITGRELDSNFSIKTCYMFSGETVSVRVNKSPSNAIWSNPTDFSYSGYSTASVTYSALTGKFTAGSSTQLYSTIVTATHKVTNRTKTFTLVINPNAILIGVTNSGHDHSSALNSIKSTITGCNYSNAILYTGAFTKSSLIGYLDENSNNLFVSRSHGGTTATGTFIQLFDTEAGDCLYSTDLTSSYDLSNMKLIMYVACSTGFGGESGSNLPSVSVLRGAGTAVGFAGTINCSKANSWTIAVFNYISNGTSLKNACDTLSASATYIGSGLENVVICGYKYVKIG